MNPPLLIFAGILLLWTTAVPQTKPSESLTKEQWREDLKYLAKELPSRHKNVFHTVTEAQFRAAVAELTAAIPSLQEHEILVGLRRIVAMVGDAHTDVEPAKNFHRYPVTLYWFGNDLRVLRTTAAFKRALGARVVGIGSLDLPEVVQRVNSLVPKENEQFQRYSNVSLMPLAEVLHALKIAPGLDRATWTFEDASGSRFSLDLAPVPRDEKIDWLSTLKDVPLYRQRLNELMWTTTIPEAKTVYLNLKVYPDSSTFKRVSKEMFDLIDTSGAKRLIIDVRQSNGGDFFKFRSNILDELKSRAAFRRPNSVFVVIGRGTVSAAMVNAIETRDQLRATLVGEPTGSKPNSYSENDSLTLPNSKLKISYSTKYYKFQDHESPSLDPDKRIDPTWELYTAGRDPAIEWILSQPLPN